MMDDDFTFLIKNYIIFYLIKKMKLEENNKEVVLIFLSNFRI